MLEACSSGSADRRLKIVPNAFAEKPVLKLILSATIRAAERRRAFEGGRV